MFTTPCFIRYNTPEIRYKLDNLGYRPYDDSICYYHSLYTTCNGVYFGEKVHENAIDCTNNEELFLAIAALRDDSDYMQYFVTEVRLGSVNTDSVIHKGTLIKCLNDKWIYPKNIFDSMCIPAHKATIHELISRIR